MSIPQRLFYMWCGSSKPADVNLCLRNWREKMPDAEIVELNETDKTYFDFSKELKENDWFRAVYERKMWGFVADYVRFKVLYDHGGVWLDTDVSLEKSLEPLLNTGILLGRENNNHVESAIIGGEKGHPYLKSLVEFYNDEVWKNKIYTSPRVATYFLEKNYGFKAGCEGILKFDDVIVYPPEYLYPLPVEGVFSDSCLSENSYAIHWWKASWARPEITEWLKKKHIWGKEKAMKTVLKSFKRLYLFGFLKIGRYDDDTGVCRIFGLPLFKYKKTSKRKKVLLFGFLPLLKLK